MSDLSESDRQKLWEKIPQEIFPSTTVLQDLPQKLTRKCCPGKTCGNVTITLQCEANENLVTGERTVIYGYTRDNGDFYFSADSPQSLIGKINNPMFWPDHWDERYGK